MRRLQKIVSHFALDQQQTQELSSTKSANNNALPKQMRGLYKDKPVKGYELRYDLPVPSPKDDEILVKSMSVGICGSDAKIYKWQNITEDVAVLPFIPGHECSGLVVGVGKNVNNFIVGDRIAVEPHLFCGNIQDCFQCRIGREDICPKMGNFGWGLNTAYGGCCEYFVVKTKYCYKLTQPYISWREAALLEPMGVACNAVDNLDVDINETVLVTGCGAIGCFVISILKAYGCKDIFALDIFDSKLVVARKMGAKHVFNGKTDGDFVKYARKMTNGTGFGRVVECTGNVDIISSMFKVIRKGGGIVMVGVPLKTIKIENAMHDWVLNSLQIRSVHGRRIFKSMRTAEKLIRDNTIDTDEIVTHFLPLTQFEKGYADWFEGKTLKVMFDPTK